MPTISHITLELARESGHPHGSSEHAYHLYLPLRDDGSIDADAWRKDRALFRVRKIVPGKVEERGRIVHGPGGRWYFDYDDATARDDEAGFNFRDENFVAGEYVSIRENDGRMHTFQVISVRPE
jgi:hypothetical protein